MLTEYSIAECIVDSSLFSVTSQIAQKVRHHTCFFPQEPQAAAPAPVGEDVPRASLCSVQSAPPKPVASVSGPLGTEKCPGKVIFLPYTALAPTYGFILTQQEIFSSSSRYCLGLQGVLESQAIFKFLIRFL